MRNDNRLKTVISKYMSYLLRHNPKGLRIREDGFVDLSALLEKLRERFPWVDEDLIREVVDRGERKRFEIKDGKIRALYGHSIPVELELEEDRSVKVLYHGTTPEAVSEILKTGLKPMKRRWVHLSPTVEIARRVGLRRTRRPVILEIDAERARKEGLKFYKATDEVYLSDYIPPKYIKRVIKS
ncbi:MAG: RNA 2'-phosphotransferase [Thaumarchaeota archaeon]|nr:RNA 2'-phosphotransferase [Nitrososphaerota archaeon]